MSDAAADRAALPQAFVDLHCHTRGSFDSLSDPVAVMRAAVTRGLTHLAITDHDHIDQAVRARDRAPTGLTVIVGEEIRTTAGDLIAVFLERAIPPGLPPDAAIAAVREQGGMVGIPHPFDRFRGSLLRDERLASLAGSVDWVETFNARLIGGGNGRAAAFAREHGLPGVAVSDAHSVLEVGVAYSIMHGYPGTPDGLRLAMAGLEIVPGRASYVARAITPLAKVIQRLRGNTRERPAQPSETAAIE